MCSSSLNNDEINLQNILLATYSSHTHTRSH